MRIHTIIPSTIVFLILACHIHAQDTTSVFTLGVFGSGLYDRHVSSFPQLPGIPNCCSEFTGSSDGGIDAGLMAEYQLSDLLAVSVRIGYAVMDSKMRERQFIGYGQRGTEAVPAYVEHYLSTELGMLHATPSLVVAPLRNIPLKLELGLQAGLFVRKQFIQYEKLDAGSIENGLVFADGRIIRGEYSGTLPDVTPIFAAIRGIIRYDVPIGSSLILSPEAGYSIPLSDVIQNTQWKIRSLNGALSIRYRFDVSNTDTQQMPWKSDDQDMVPTSHTEEEATSETMETLVEQSVPASPGKCWCLLYKSYESDREAQRAVTVLKNAGVADARSVVWSDPSGRRTHHRVISGCFLTTAEASGARKKSPAAMQLLKLETIPDIIEWNK